MRMRMKILLLCLGGTLIALLLQTTLFQRATASLIYNQAKNESFNLLQSMQNEIYLYVKNMESNLIEIYNNKEFMQDIKANTDIDTMKEKHYRIAYNLATEHFLPSDNVVSFYVYTKENELISSYRRAVTPKHNYPKDIYEQPELYNADKVKKYIESDDKYIMLSSYYNPYRETDIVRFVLKIYENANTGEKAGYVVCDVDSKVFRKIMVKYSTYQDVCIWLQPTGDRPITCLESSEPAGKEFYEEISQKIAQYEFGDFLEESSGKRVLFQVPQNKYNLTAYAIMPQAILEQNQKALTQNLILIGLMMCFVLTFVSIYISKGLTRPLERLNDTIAQIRAGDTHKRVEYLEKNEIGELGGKFNDMLDEMEQLIGHEYETKLLLNKAEYKALQAQINPHFLYNTLDTMSSIASIQNCAMVSNLCQSLSSIFRYSLDTKHPFSTVAKEIVHLKNYIYVMNVRMQEEISYQFDIEDTVLLYSLPRLSIQPLVENAINHGLRNKKGEKEIVIQAKELGELLQIVVKDNGIGMDAALMNEKLAGNNQEAAESGNSIGLYNINARMKMLYGEEFGLRIESDGKSGTNIYLTIPRRRFMEEDA